MRKDDITTALELMQGGLKFSSYPRIDDGREFRLWKWRLRLDTHNGFKTQLDAVRDFCQWYAQTRVVKDEQQPAPFDLDDFMMNGIQALVRAAKEEMQARGQEFDAETVAGQLAMSWHDFEARREAGRWPYEDTPMGDDYGG